MDELKRSRICLAAASVVLLWAVMAFGSYADGYRSLAILGTFCAGAVCLVLLPGRRLIPHVPWTLTGAVAVLFAFGWFMVANAHAEHSFVTWQFTPLHHLTLLPGSVARSTSLRAMLELSAVLIALFAAVRSTESSAWRSLVAMVVLLGLLVALTGFLHKATGAKAVWWVNEEHPPTLFAPFIYNANAGAFMNLCLPLAIGLALSRPGDDRARSAGIFWGIVSVILATGVFVAASKGALGILLVTLIVALGWNWRRLFAIVGSFFSEGGRKTERLTLLVFLTILTLGLCGIGIGLLGERLGIFFDRIEESGGTGITGREQVIERMLEMSGPSEGSWHGFGPGTFQQILPYFNLDDKVAQGRWLHGHSDPLQTTVEWGWLGAAAWWTIGAGAVLSAALLLKRRLLGQDEVPILRGAIIGLAFLGVHSCVDFPLSNYAIHLVAMLLCGVCWGLYATRKREAPERQT